MSHRYNTPKAPPTYKGTPKSKTVKTPNKKNATRRKTLKFFGIDENQKKYTPTKSKAIKIFKEKFQKDSELLKDWVLLLAAENILLSPAVKELVKNMLLTKPKKWYYLKDEVNYEAVNYEAVNSDEKSGPFFSSGGMKTSLALLATITTLVKGASMNNMNSPVIPANMQDIVNPQDIVNQEINPITPLTYKDKINEMVNTPTDEKNKYIDVLNAVSSHPKQTGITTIDNTFVPFIAGTKFRMLFVNSEGYNSPGLISSHGIEIINTCLQNISKKAAATCTAITNDMTMKSNMRKKTVANEAKVATKPLIPLNNLQTQYEVVSPYMDINKIGVETIIHKNICSHTKMPSFVVLTNDNGEETLALDYPLTGDGITLTEILNMLAVDFFRDDVSLEENDRRLITGFIEILQSDYADVHNSLKNTVNMWTAFPEHALNKIANACEVATDSLNAFATGRAFEEDVIDKTQESIKGKYNKERAKVMEEKKQQRERDLQELKDTNAAEQETINEKGNAENRRQKDKNKIDQERRLESANNVAKNANIAVEGIAGVGFAPFNGVYNAMGKLDAVNDIRTMAKNLIVGITFFAALIIGRNTISKDNIIKFYRLTAQGITVPMFLFHITKNAVGNLVTGSYVVVQLVWVKLNNVRSYLPMVVWSGNTKPSAADLRNAVKPPTNDDNKSAAPPVDDNTVDDNMEEFNSMFAELNLNPSPDLWGMYAPSGKGGPRHSTLKKHPMHIKGGSRHSTLKKHPMHIKGGSRRRIRKNKKN